VYRKFWVVLLLERARPKDEMGQISSGVLLSATGRFSGSASGRLMVLQLISRFAAS